MSSPKPITCRAAVMYDYNKPLVVEKVRIDPPSGRQVRVKLLSSGICLTDLSVFTGKSSAAEIGSTLPLVLGHEGAGIVESVGDKVTGLKPGDHVLTTFLPRCGSCIFCDNPKVNICAVDNFGTLGSVANKTLVGSGKEVQSITGLGTLSEYLLVKENQLEKIDSNIPNLENLSIVTCAIGSGYFATTELKPGTTVAIWDLSGFGINAAYGAKLRGAKNIIVIDPSDNPEWADLAKEFGVTELVNPNKLGKPVEQYLLEKFGGVDYAFDCNGDPKSQIEGIKSLNPGGEFTFVAMTSSEAAINMKVNDLVANKSIRMSIYGTTSTDAGYREVLNLYQIGKYPVGKLISHKFKLEQVNEAVQTAIDHKTIRTVITF